jgi:hypothetical protein
MVDAVYSEYGLLIRNWQKAPKMSEYCLYEIYVIY